MRRIQITSFLALPSALALSLSNFQEISSTVTPLSCLLTYETQLGGCQEKDFSKGCSNDCVRNLLSIQADVQDACSTITVNPSTLLGIVKSGGIIAALCPILASTTSRIPTSHPGVEVPTSTITAASTTTARQTIISIVSPVTSSKSSTSSTFEIPLITATAASSTTPKPVPVSATASNRASAASSSSGSKATPKPDAGSGGGSPFDISSIGSMDGCNLVLGVGLVLAWAGYFLGR